MRYLSLPFCTAVLRARTGTLADQLEVDDDTEGLELAGVGVSLGLCEGR